MSDAKNPNGYAASAAQAWLAQLERASRLATPDIPKTRLTYSAIFGWAVRAATTQVIRLAGSGQYQIRLPEVTSY